MTDDDLTVTTLLCPDHGLPLYGSVGMDGIAFYLKCMACPEKFMFEVLQPNEEGNYL